MRDRVKVRSTSTGTGSFTISTSITGFQTFSVFTDTTDSFVYTIQHETADEWEIGIGTKSSTTLTRATILQSSNSDNAVNFSSGSKIVFATIDATRLDVIDKIEKLTWMGW